VRILIAEDDEDIARSYTDIFKGRGHSVIITHDGKECVKTYAVAMEMAFASKKQNGGAAVMPFDVVLLDYRMPHENGLEVAREILALNPEQRVIFASAYVKDALEDSIRRLRHAIELVEKPFDPKTLVETVEDTKVFTALKQLNASLQQIVELDLTDKQQIDLLSNVRRVMKGKSF
jgi:CheY-like chemotaxis protein